MSLNHLALLAASALALSCGSAFAQSATANANVNVRSGPGGNYQVIDRLPAGEPVNVIDCRGDWCEISMGGESGFVARSYLDDGGARRSRARVMEDDDYGSEQISIESYEPESTAGLAIGGYYESRPFYVREGYYYWGGRWYGRRPGVAGWRNGSWRRFEDRRGPGNIRDGRANRPPRIDDRRARIDRDDRSRDPRIQPIEPRRGGGDGERDRRDDRIGSQQDRDRGSADRGGRDERPASRGPSIDQRAERPEGRSGDGALENRGGGQSGGGQSGVGRTPGGGGDRGDRVGLDRAGGGGGRNDR